MPDPAGALHILYFAWLRERVGLSEEHLAPPASVTTIGELITWLAERDERHAAAFAQPGLVRCALNQEFSPLDSRLTAGDEIAFFPPGDRRLTMARIRVQSEPFDTGAELAALTAGRADIGGLGCFVGLVRQTQAGRKLTALTLEHYPGMTEAALTRIATEAEARWSLLDCTVIHRHGRLGLGEPIVLVLAAAAHRAAALEATAFLIDWLKTRAPFWKSEEYEDGVREWVTAREADDQAAEKWT